MSEVMDGAGMTVGGFYAHFPSKEALVAETVSCALEESRQGLGVIAGGKHGADWLKAVERSYLSRRHRDNARSGCPLPATAGEIAAADQSVRDALAREVYLMTNGMADHLVEAGSMEPESEAFAFLATMVGGLSLARALKGTPLSDKVLKACRDHIERCLE